LGYSAADDWTWAAERPLRSGITGFHLVCESESAPGKLSVTVRNLLRVYHYHLNRDFCRRRYGPAMCSTKKSLHGDALPILT
uniref:SH2 domain-containing protein n=1 Tax=Taenia asiatica TaxID=60517 RepID=A0A0R3W0K0_TAEAS